MKIERHMLEFHGQTSVFTPEPRDWVFSYRRYVKLLNAELKTAQR